jgi:hypothetical protein
MLDLQIVKHKIIKDIYRFSRLIDFTLPSAGAQEKHSGQMNALMDSDT